MNKKIWFLAIFISLLAACSSEKNFAPPSLLSQNEGKYMILFLFEETASPEEASEFSKSVLDAAQERDLLYEAKLEIGAEEYSLDLDKLPAIVIVDSEEIVLKTYNQAEAINFLHDAS